MKVNPTSSSLSDRVSLLLAWELGFCYSLLSDVSPPSSAGGNELNHATCQGVPSMTTNYGLVNSNDMNCHKDVHRLCGFFTQTVSPSLYWADITWLGRSTSTPFTQILYECSRLAGTEEADTSSLGVMYQYTASIIEHLFHAAICFTVSTMPFPDSLYAQHS